MVSSRSGSTLYKHLKAALAGGADCLVLCETNGGTITSKVVEIIKAVQERFPNAVLGIHAHNDAEMGVANSIAAVELGASQVQGTINGFGKRCGNANLCSIIPSIKLKLGLDCISEKNLRRLTELSRFVYGSPILTLTGTSRTSAGALLLTKAGYMLPR